MNREAFDDVAFHLVVDGLLRARDALDAGREAVAQRSVPQGGIGEGRSRGDDYPIVEVQSDDREFIELLRRPGAPKSRCAACGEMVPDAEIVTVNVHDTARDLGIEVGDFACTGCYGG